MSVVQLDQVEELIVDSQSYFNEVRTLGMLQTGLKSLAGQIRGREMRYADVTKAMTCFQMGGTSPEEVAELDFIACIFHWFGVSICNYARLIGFIRGLELKEFGRDDLKDKTTFERIKTSVKRYVESIPELAPVLVWRNKVGGHFAITDPRKDDNIATLNMSVMFPVTLESGLYFVGGISLTQENSAGAHSSAIPRWSVSEVFEELLPRYWPNLRYVTDEQQDEAAKKSVLD
ncbi:MAG: hypothetical protein K1X57_15355 [Gemmataceae bacterium]|nr:hypothetical protein [Gemmataceae bacterium]